MTNVHVELGERSYHIHIAADNLHQLKALLPDLNKNVFVLSNPTVAKHYFAQVEEALVGHHLVLFEMNDGEQYKSLSSFEAITNKLIAEGFSRDCAIVALGGGVVGDLAGFVAATYHRGVDFYQIPTTLLSQVDSSVGGKTAINHPQDKNLIGAFYQPKAVVIDLNCLATLTERDYRSGLAEIVKYGIIYDADFFQWLEQHADALSKRSESALQYAIQRSCEIKAEIVAKDERESGIRAWLNLGHTFGHAIEAATEYGDWTHGEAVAAGTIIASKLSEKTQRMSSSDFRRVLNLMSTLQLPTQAPNMAFADWLSYMKRDKKVKDNRINFVLPLGIGKAEVTNNLTDEELAAVLTECC